jgi:hypothetical protein
MSNGGSLSNFLPSGYNQTPTKLDFATLQYKFLIDLADYINGYFITSNDLIFYFFSRRKAFYRNAKICVSKLNYLKDEATKIRKDREQITICVDAYKGNNRYVYEMIKYLEKNLKNDLYGAYLHGSLATYEECNYSDFDAVVIIKNEVFSSPEKLCDVAIKLHKASSIMFKFDPLQHHGWFVLTAMDLECYPAIYFPHEIFNNAKSLFRDMGLTLDININISDASDRDIFSVLSKSIKKLIQHKEYPRNMYQLKSLLSKFMLLPSLYVQSRDGYAIFKKFSFNEVKKDFSNEEWEVMEEVSRVRGSWTYRISPLKFLLMARSNRLSRYLAKIYGPRIPKSILNILTDTFYEKMFRLIKAMEAKLQIQVSSEDDSGFIDAKK